MHYHDEGYEKDNDYGVPPEVMRSVCIYAVFTTELSFNLADYKETQCTIFPFMPRWPRSLPFHEEVCWHLTFDQMPSLMTEIDSDDEEYFSTAELDDHVWSKDPVPDSQENLCINEIPRPVSPPLQP